MKFISPTPGLLYFLTSSPSGSYADYTLRMNHCPRSLNSVVRWKHFPSPTLAPHSLFDIGKLDIQQVKCVLRVTKLVNGTAGLLSSIEIGY